MTEPLAFLNGLFVPQSQACVTLHDAGFVYGATVTDLCRTFRHRIYRWPKHLARFRRSCQSAYLNILFDDDAITEHAERLVANNADLIDANGDLALVLFATPGPIGHYLGQDITPGAQPTFGMHTFSLPLARYRSWIEHGVSLVTPGIRQIPAVCVPANIKQRSRMHYWLAEQEVRRTDPGAQALLLDLAGNITETASSNILVVHDGEIIAPLADSILEGVSLGVVAEFCGRLGIALKRRSIPLSECYDADEILLTCTSFCLAGVRQLNGRAIPCPGPMLRRLWDAWNTEVGIDILRQMVG